MTPAEQPMQQVASASGAMPGKLATSAAIAQPFQSSVTDAITARRDQQRTTPKLVGILATPSPPSIAYAQSTKRACEQVGIEFVIWQTWSSGDEKDDSNTMLAEGKPGIADTDLEADVEDLIIAANGDDSIHGIMVYYPIFGGRQDTYLQQIVDPRKDVEGLHFSYCFNMYHNIRWVLPSELGGAPGTSVEASAGGGDDGELVPSGYAKSILPCTPLAVVKCLEALGAYDKTLPYGDRLYGKVITVVNRSEVVGRPLAALLSNDGAKVYSADVDSIQEFNKRAKQDGARKPSETVETARQRIAARRLRPHHIIRPCAMSLEECIAASDVVISGVPSPNFKIKTEWIKEGTVTVNFSSEKNFEKDVRMRASIHLPAIGKMTIAMLQRNLLRLVEYREITKTKSENANLEVSMHDGSGPPGASDGNDGSQQDQKPKADNGFSGRPTDAQHPSNSNGQSGGSGAQGDVNGMRDQAVGENGRSEQGTDSLMPAQGRFAFTMRERASTMVAPRSDYSRDRVLGPSSRHDPSAPYYSRGQPSNWEWRNGSNERRDSGQSGSTGTPPFGPTRVGSSSGQSSLLFAPIGPRPASASHGQPPQYQQGSYPRPPHVRSSGSKDSLASPRSATPVSPIVMDGLSVEDSSSSSHQPGSQRPSWDAGQPRTPHDGPEVVLLSQSGANTQLPSVLERVPDKDMATRYDLSHSDEKMPVARTRPHDGQTPHGYGSDYHTMIQPQGMVGPSPHMRGGMPLHGQMAIGQPQERIAHSRRRRRPPYSYSSLISQAIQSSPEGRMTLREIYTWISNRYPDMYSMEGQEGSGWQNTVRHNLSLNKCFIKVARTAQDIFESCSSGMPNLSQAARGKGGWWMLDPNVTPPSMTAQNQGDMEIEDLDTASAVRPPQRRRTSSMAMSMRSEEDDMAPFEPNTPSVLQHQLYTPQINSRPLKHDEESKDTVPSVLQPPLRPRSAERPATGPTESTTGNYAAVNRPLAGRPRARGYTMTAAELPGPHEHGREARQMNMAAAKAAHFGTPYTGGRVLPSNSPMPPHSVLGAPPLPPLASRSSSNSTGLTPASRLLSLSGASNTGGLSGTVPPNASIMSPGKRKTRYEEEMASERPSSAQMRDELPLRSPALGVSNMGQAMPTSARSSSANLPPLPPLHGRPASMSVSHSGPRGGNFTHTPYMSKAGQLPPPPPSPLSAVHTMSSSQRNGTVVSALRGGKGSQGEAIAGPSTSSEEVAKSTTASPSTTAAIPRSSMRPPMAAGIEARAAAMKDDDGPGGSRMAIGGLLNS